MTLSVGRVIGHREWSPGRKTDPRYDMNWRRSGVAGIAPRAPVTTHPAAAGEDPVHAFDWPPGPGRHKLICPVGSASGVAERAWFSLACDGEISNYSVWFQRDDAGIAEHHGAVAKDRRVWWELPNGATQITVHYLATGPVGAALEIKSR